MLLYLNYYVIIDVEQIHNTYKSKCFIAETMFMAAVTLKISFPQKTLSIDF